jgi:hypothetical protein
LQKLLRPDKIGARNYGIFSRKGQVSERGYTPSKLSPGLLSFSLCRREIERDFIAPDLKGIRIHTRITDAVITVY